jgi:hypothetical protein
VGNPLLLWNAPCNGAGSFQEHIESDWMISQQGNYNDIAGEL